MKPQVVKRIPAFEIDDFEYLTDNDDDLVPPLANPQPPP